ncbi:hypothetical protein POBR111598_10025 [Polynucleobacter brandtiae]
MSNALGLLMKFLAAPATKVTLEPVKAKVPGFKVML